MEKAGASMTSMSAGRVEPESDGQNVMEGPDPGWERVAVPGLS
jgi:hypothetical protein